MKIEETSCSRRELFRTMFSELASAVGALASSGAEPLRAALSAGKSTLRPPAEPLVRPPGAATEELFLELCTRCGDCAKACPEWVVLKAGPERGALQEGTPLLLPAQNPCLFCAGLPCAAACATGALVPPAAGERVRIGLARVDGARCRSALGRPCDRCVDECPVRPKAVSVGAGAAAVVDAEACTGCGLCAQACPADAVTIEARR